MSLHSRSQAQSTSNTHSLTSPSKLRIAFIHPDLGIGGAERLVVDAAVGLQKRGHLVQVFTSSHHHNRCFQETRDGQLSIHTFLFFSILITNLSILFVCLFGYVLQLQVRSTSTYSVTQSFLGLLPIGSSPSWRSSDNFISHFNSSSPSGHHLSLDRLIQLVLIFISSINSQHQSPYYDMQLGLESSFIVIFLTFSSPNQSLTLIKLLIQPD